MTSDNQPIADQWKTRMGDTVRIVKEHNGVVSVGISMNRKGTVYLTLSEVARIYDDMKAECDY